MLSDLIKPRMCEVGKIKIGGKESKVRESKGGGTWRAPMKFDHFVITTLNRNPAGDLVEDATLMERLVEECGDPDGKLRRLPVAVLSDDPEDIMQASWVCYGGKRVAARSDGKTVEWFYDRKTRNWLDKPVSEPWSDEIRDLKDNRGAAMFKLHTCFNCVITTKEARWGGVYKFRTTSRISADQLYGSMLHLRELTRGVLAGLPLQLVVRPIQVSPEGKTTTVYVVHLELRGPDLMSIQNMAARMLEAKVGNAKAIEAGKAEYRRMLVAPGYETDEREIIDVTEEFHPETVEEAPPSDGESAIDDLLGNAAVASKVEQQADPGDGLFEDEKAAIREREIAEASK